MSQQPYHDPYRVNPNPINTTSTLNQPGNIGTTGTTYTPGTFTQPTTLNQPGNIDTTGTTYTPGTFTQPTTLNPETYPTSTTQKKQMGQEGQQKQGYFQKIKIGAQNLFHHNKGQKHQQNP